MAGEGADRARRPRGRRSAAAPRSARCSAGALGAELGDPLPGAARSRRRCRSPCRSPGTGRRCRSSGARFPQSGQTSSVAQERVRWSAERLIGPRNSGLARAGRRPWRTSSSACPDFPSEGRTSRIRIATRQAGARWPATRRRPRASLRAAAPRRSAGRTGASTRGEQRPAPRRAPRRRRGSAARGA